MRVDPVQPRQGLHGVEATEDLVDVHGVQQRLVEPGLELFGHDQHLVVVGVEPLGGLPVREAVHAGLGEVVAAVEHLARERHQRRQTHVVLRCDVLVDRLLVPHRMQPRGGHHHRLGMAADLGGGVLTEVFDDDLGLLRQVRRVQRHEPGDRRFRPRLVMLGVVGDRLLDLPVRLVRRVVLQHVEDEPLLDRLAHRVQVERHEPLTLSSRLLAAEDLQGLGLRCRREREERDVRLPTATGHRHHHLVVTVTPGSFLRSLGCLGCLERSVVVVTVRQRGAQVLG